jgi:hypothetical protein
MWPVDDGGQQTSARLLAGTFLQANPAKNDPQRKNK